MKIIVNRGTDRLIIDRYKEGATVADILTDELIARRMFPKYHPAIRDKFQVWAHGKVVPVDTLLKDGDEFDLHDYPKSCRGGW